MMKPREHNPTNLTRRRLLKSAAAATAAAGFASLLPGCGDSASSSTTTAPSVNVHVNPGEGPESPKMNFGMIALTDCSPIVIAHEKGFFAKYGIESKVSKIANWAAIRDALVNGETQATHMLIGTPLALTMGVAGTPKAEKAGPVPVIIPWLLNRNGQAISLRKDLAGKITKDTSPLKPMVDEAAKSGTKMTFAMTYPPGTHAMWMRYWLAAGGIHPDKDINLIVVPPAQMVANMKIGKMDGFCVGEPWNARIIQEGAGYTAITTQELWPDHPEKVCAFKEEFAEKNPKTVKAVLKALNEASVWLDDMKNRPEQCAIVSKPTYINCPADLILGRMQGHYDYGDGRKLEDPKYMIFSSRNCNYPQAKYATWWLSQFRRWGMVENTPDYAGVAKRVMRSDIYEEAMKEIGYAHGGADSGPETLFDGKTFDPAKPEEYAASFEVNNFKA